MLRVRNVSEQMDKSPREVTVVNRNLVMVVRIGGGGVGGSIRVKTVEQCLRFQNKSPV